MSSLSIVIPTCGRPKHLLVLLENLVLQTRADDEIIVSDDRFEVKMAEDLGSRFNEIRVIPGPGIGPAANRNNGAKASQHSWIVFLDDDVVPDEQLLSAYRKEISTENFEVLEGRTYSEPDITENGLEAPINETGGNLWSCNFAIKRTAFTDLVGFSEYYLAAGGEDTDFNLRVNLLKLRRKFCPSAAIYHPPRRIAGAYSRVMKRRYGIIGDYRWGKSKAELCTLYAIRLLRYQLAVYPSLKMKFSAILEALLLVPMVFYWRFADSGKWNSARLELVEWKRKFGIK